MTDTISLPPGFALSRPTRDNAAEVLALLSAYDVATYGTDETTLEDVLDVWDELDLDRDAWLARDATGALRGYATASAESDRVNCDYYTLLGPAWGELATALLRVATARAAAIQAASPQVRPVAFTLQPSVHIEARQAALACGYRLTGHHFRMQLDLTAAPPPPAWPQGITLRPMRPGEDDRAIHAFVQQAFARPGRVAQPFDEWQGFMMRADHFRPDLWFLAEASAADGAAELAGVALCYDYPDLGWVRQLAVAENWRRRGLASALLRHAFGVFYVAGRPVVSLGVLSDNDRALRLYESVGMRRVRQIDDYEKELPAE